MLAEHIQSTYRFALPIHNQVRNVEIHRDIPEPHILDDPQQCDRSLLAGFAHEGLAVVPAVLSYVADDFHHLRVERVVWVFRNKTAVGMNGSNATRLREIRRPLKSGNAGLP